MKRFISLVLCALLLGSFAAAACAAGDSALQILGYQQNEGSLDILLYAKNKNMSLISDENLSVRLDDIKLPVDGLRPLAGSEYGTSWIVVLEPAPNNEIADTAPALVERLVSNLGPKDNLAVLDSRTREMSSFVRDMPTIRAFVKAATAPTYDGGYVRLYDAINTAFSAFKENTELNPRKCLLLFSGCVDTNSACSLSELLRQAKDAPATVYTVGITRGIDSYTSAFETLRALSDASPSGMAFALESFPSSAGADAAITVLDNEKSCSVLTAGLENVTDAMTGTLHVSLNALDASLANVTVTPAPGPDPEDCTHEWGDDATCQHARTCVKCGIEDPDGKRAAHKDDGSGRCVWCGEPLSRMQQMLSWLRQNMIAAVMGGVLLVLLIVLLIVLLRRKKAADDPLEDVIEDTGGETQPLRSKVTVELTKRTTGERFTGEIMDYSIKAGLESPLRLSGDPAISRRHMEFVWQNGILYVQDINSKNGTYVNGEKITRATALNQNDVIHAGESDFYVTWRSNS